MRLLGYTLREALASLRRELRRLLPMGLGIVWGMASVMVLLALAAGFEASQRQALAAYGDRFLLVRLNRAELNRAKGSDEPRLQMYPDDIERIRRGAPAIRHLSPMNNAYRARISGRSGAVSNIWVSGCLPEIALLRHLPIAEGRFYNEIDEAGRRRVIVLGAQARKQLFGKGPAVGEQIRIGGFSTSQLPVRQETLISSTSTAAVLERSGSSRPGKSGYFDDDDPQPPPTRGVGGGVTGLLRELSIRGEIFTVIGVFADEEVQHESYVSLARTAMIPFSTSVAVFDRDFNTLYLEPRSIEDRDLALAQFRAVMGARLGFHRDDRNAVLIYFDAIERARAIAAIFGGLRLFLSAVGILILAIGGVGVMNVVLVSVAARGYEIGLRKALGATPLAVAFQFFTETAIGCFLSGAVGFLVGAGIIALLSFVPLPQGFARPELDVQTAALAFALLGAVAVVVALPPARRAAAMAPALALRTGG